MRQCFSLLNAFSTRFSLWKSSRPHSHSSRSARDRDRLREQILRDLGWKLHHIWNTDGFRNSERELKRAVVAIENAKYSN